MPSGGQRRRRVTRCPSTSRTSILTRPARGSEGAVSSESLAIHDESGMLGQLIIESHGRDVRMVRLPVHARRSLGSRAIINGFDQTAADAIAAQLRRSEKVLQIAGLGR